MPEIIQPCFLGCDPGLSGGMAILQADGRVVDASPMPKTPRDIFDYFEEFTPLVRFALIEAVHAMPDQGVSGVFKFGWCLGLLDMALVRIPHESVQPGVWQRAFGLIRANKQESRVEKKNRHKRVAQELFPNVKVTHALADALLIAAYAKRTFGG
jgi:crossover junction endodeoxyribonuclease RuvC